MQRHSYAQVLLASIMTFLIMVAGVHAGDPVVRAVLFYSPSCAHCHKVITEDLPPLFEKYGDQLQIIGINIADPGGSAIFSAAGDKFSIPSEYRGVPFLVIADVVLIGSLDIPQQLPGLIEKYLAAGGVGWPDIPGLAEAIAQAEAAQPTATPAPPSVSVASTASLAPTLVPTIAAAATQPASTPTPTPGIVMVSGSSGEGFGSRFERDPIGNGLAIIVLAGMIAVVGWVIAQRPWRAWGTGASTSRSGQNRPAGGPLDWAVPLLSLIGLGIAGYLAYVETQQVQAVCGPVGDCNSVQQSEYARLFGLLPIGVLGVLGYLAILALWAIHRFSPRRIGRWAGLAVWAMAACGVLFSIYLTFLEPFVIGATCAWCLSSAVIMTLLLLLTTAHASGARTWVRRGEAEGEQPTS